MQYHFKDTAGLVAAILEDRVGRIETLRREQLAAMQLQGRDDPRELLRVLWLPILSIRDTYGVHTFSRFLLHVMLQSYVDQHPVHKLYSASGKRNSSAAKDLPCVIKATRMLRSHYGHLSETVLNRRMASLSMMFLATVVEYDNAKLSGKLAAHTQLDAELILDMAVGALAVRTWTAVATGLFAILPGMRHGSVTELIHTESGGQLDLALRRF